MTRAKGKPRSPKAQRARQPKAVAPKPKAYRFTPAPRQVSRGKWVKIAELPRGKFNVVDLGSQWEIYQNSSAQ